MKTNNQIDLMSLILININYHQIIRVCQQIIMVMQPVQNTLYRILILKKLDNSNKL